MSPPSKRRRRGRGPARVPGLPPGTLHHEPGAPPPVLHIFGFGPDSFEELSVHDVADVAALRGRWPVLWVNVNGLGDATVIEGLGHAFGLHVLALEDVSHVGQRPKVDVYPDSVFVVMRMLSWQVPGFELDSEQLAIFFGKDFVLSFQERVGDPFDPVRERIRKGRPRLRAGGADYLAYALLDSVIDHLFPLMQAYGDVLEELEDEVLDNPTQATFTSIRRARRALIEVRRMVWPLRDAMGALQAEHVILVKAETRIFLRDVQDHVLRVIDLAETYRDEVSGLVDAYLSSLSFRMNEVMGLLTLVGTIFLPLGFLTGLYGMNFDPEASPWNMPELGMRFGYPALLLVMGLVAVLLVLYFRRRGWLELTGILRDRERS